MFGKLQLIAFSVSIFPFLAFGAEPESTKSVPESAAEANGSEAESMNDRVRAVVLQNKAARQGIDGYSMRLIWKRREFQETPLTDPLPEGTVISYGEGIWVERGGKFHVNRLKRWERPDAANAEHLLPDLLALEGKEYSSWAVYNGDYYAMHSSKLQGRVYMFPRDTLDSQLAQPDGELYPYPITWGFGFGGAYLDVEYEKGLAHSIVSWKREDYETGDGPKIKLTRSTYIEKLGGDRRTEFVVDPQRGFMIASVNTWEPAGALISQVTITLEALPAGGWFPSRAVERVVDTYYEYDFKDVVLNPEVDDSHFTIDALIENYEATRLHRRTLAGQTRMLFRDGQWVPESMVPKALRPVFPGEGKQNRKTFGKEEG